MPIATLDVYTVVLFLHVSAAIVAFGILFAYPLLFTFAERGEPRSLPAFLHFARRADRFLVNPAMVVVLLAGLYLASDRWEFSQTWIGIAIAIIVVLFGLQGAVLTPTRRKLAVLAERDVKAAGTGEVHLSAEYDALAKRAGIVGAVSMALVLAAVLVMVWKPGL